MNKIEHLPTFSQEIKKDWIIKKDECNDEYIALNGKKALGKGGLDHIYMISQKDVGYWFSGNQNTMLNKLKSQIPNAKIIQGGGEVIYSIPVEYLNSLCKIAKARKRVKLSEEVSKSRSDRCKKMSATLKHL